MSTVSPAPMPSSVGSIMISSLVPITGSTPVCGSTPGTSRRRAIQSAAACRVVAVPIVVGYAGASAASASARLTNSGTGSTGLPMDRSTIPSGCAAAFCLYGASLSHGKSGNRLEVSKITPAFSPVRRPGRCREAVPRERAPRSAGLVGVDLGEDLVGDGLELGDLVGREGVDDVLADGRDVARGGGDEGFVAGVGDGGDGDPAVVVGGTAYDEAAVLQSLDHVREPRQRTVGEHREVTHPPAPPGRLGQAGEHEVLEVRQPRIPLQLIVEHARQLEDQRGQ